MQSLILPAVFSCRPAVVWGEDCSKRGPAEGVCVRLVLGVAVIAVGVANLCFQHRWHRVLGGVAVAVGLILCALVWFR
jgi:hypothetical protein